MNKQVSSSRQQRWISSSSYWKLWTPKMSRHIPSWNLLRDCVSLVRGCYQPLLLHGRPRYLLSGSPYLITTAVAKPPAAQSTAVAHFMLFCHSQNSPPAVPMPPCPCRCVYATFSLPLLLLSITDLTMYRGLCEQCYSNEDGASFSAKKKKNLNN